MEAIMGSFVVFGSRCRTRFKAIQMCLANIDQDLRCGVSSFTGLINNDIFYANSIYMCLYKDQT